MASRVANGKPRPEFKVTPTVDNSDEQQRKRSWLARYLFPPLSVHILYVHSYIFSPHSHNATYQHSPFAFRLLLFAMLVTVTDAHHSCCSQNFEHLHTIHSSHPRCTPTLRFASHTPLAPTQQKPFLTGRTTQD